MAERPKPFLLSDEFLKPNDYFDLLTNTPVSKFITVPPVKPKPGELYMYYNEKCIENWKADQYRWRDKGVADVPKRAPLLRMHYYDSLNVADSESFKRRATILYKKGHKYDNKTVIHYTGSTDTLQNLPHGNRKHDKDKEYIRTAPSVIAEQKSLIKEQPIEIYKKQTTRDVAPCSMPVLFPRNKKQVTNTIAEEKNRKLLSSDDIVGAYLLHQELGTFVQEMSLLKTFFIILYENETMTLFKDISKFQGCVLNYDTTFNLGDFYVSPLTYRHPLFHENPVIPLAVLIHHVKSGEVHEKFLHHVKVACPDIDGIPIITDREDAIRLAIRKTLFKSKNFLCWNHIQRDVKHWVKSKKNATAADIKTYVSHIWDLLDTDDEDGFQTKYEAMQKQWTKEFLHYFNKELLQDIKGSSKWMLQEHQMYTPGSGITSNAAESFNSVLKRCLDRKEVNLQVIILTIYQLDLFYRKQIIRGLTNQGDFVLTDKFKYLKRDVDSIKYPQAHIPLEGLPFVFTNKDIIFKPEEDTIHTNFAVAKFLLAHNCVRLIPEEKVFLVSSFNTDQKFTVQLFPKEKCSCKIKVHCHHITACKLSLNLDTSDTKRAKLGRLIRKGRGFKSGRKGNPQKMICVEAATDAKAIELHEESSSLLIPTVTNKGHLVKHKFQSVPSNKTRDNISVRSFNLSFTSSPKKIQNKQFIIYGRQIYSSHLKPLEIKTSEAESQYDLFLPDSILDIYIPILIHEEKSCLNYVTIFSVDCMVLNYIHHQPSDMFQYGLRYFCKHIVPEKDIVIFPLTYSSHCILIIVIKRSRQIIYLNSLSKLGSSIPRMHIQYVINLYETYYHLNNIIPPFLDWVIYYPKDLPQQKNSYDYGLYCCMYAEIMIRRNLKYEKFARAANMEQYRQRVRSRLVEYINAAVPLSAPVEYDVLDKEKLETVVKKYKSISVQLNLNVHESLPNTREGTLKFLSSIIDNFWEENTLLCHLQTSKCKKGPLVLCAACEHWLHYECEGVCEEEIENMTNYMCKKCRHKTHQK